MTLILADSCGDTYAASQLVEAGWSASSVATLVTGRVSGRAIQVIGTTIITWTDCSHLIPGSPSEFTMMFAIQRPGAADGTEINILTFDEGATNHIQLAITTGGLFRIKRNGTTLATGATVMSTGVWYQVDLHVKIHDTLGEIHLRLDEVSEISSTGLDTRNGGTGVASSFTIRGGSNTVAYYWDDIHLWTGNDQKGNSRVIGCLPDATGNYSQWTPITGTDHDAMVDDPLTIDDDSTYIFNITPGNRDSFTFPALSIPSTATILGMVGWVIARKQDVGTREVNVFSRVSGTDYDGTDQGISLSYGKWSELFQNNPATAAAWSQAELNAAELGVKDGT